MAIGENFALRVFWLNDDTLKVAENTFYFQQTSALVFDTPGEDLVQAFVTEIIPVYTPILSNRYGLRKITVVLMPDNVTVHEESFPGTTAGLATGDMLPATIAPILRYRTGDFSRRGRGRLFLPPSTETYNTSTGVPTAAAQTAIADLGDALLDLDDNVLYGGWLWMMWSEADQVMKEILAHGISNRWGRQRKRERVLSL